MSVVVVSAHFDDAVLSFGGAIARAARADDLTIATVMAGMPPRWTWPTPFDNASGFSDSRKAVEARRVEDLDAAAVLGAGVVHFGFLDGQYGRHREENRMWLMLRDLFAANAMCVVPLGLAHPDHRLVTRVARRALIPAHSTAVVYADLPAAHLWPGHVAGALRGWERKGWQLTPMEWPIDLDAKRKAYDCYRSQLRFPELAWENVQEERAWLAIYAG